MLRRTLGAVGLTIAVAAAAEAQHAMPAGMSHEEHMAQMEKHAAMNQRGAAAMGFDQEAVTHRFLLTAGGGIIQVEANDGADTVTREAIRSHLRTIAVEFGRGNFSRPFHTHDELPPGAKTMTASKAAIDYRFEQTPEGGRVRITTRDRGALDAVHDFLRYQIEEHATGDPLTVSGSGRR